MRQQNYTSTRTIDSVVIRIPIVHFSRVSSLNAMDKTPMYEMPLIYVLGVWGLGFWGEQFLYWGFGQWYFVIGVLS